MNVALRYLQRDVFIYLKTPTGSRLWQKERKCSGISRSRDRRCQKYTTLDLDCISYPRVLKNPLVVPSPKILTTSPKCKILALEPLGFGSMAIHTRCIQKSYYCTNSNLKRHSYLATYHTKSNDQIFNKSIQRVNMY